jgi:ankyrin repeat protein
VNLRGPGGITPLLAAALYGDAALVRRLIAMGADVDAASPAGGTPLMWALPDVAKMRLLLDAGADPDAQTDEGRTPLLIASGTAGAAPAVRLLLEYGGDATAARGDATVLREAARVNDAVTFELLLHAGVSPASAPSRFVRTFCPKCAELIRIGGLLPKQPPESNAAATAPIYDPGRLAVPTPLGATPVTRQSLRVAVERSLPLLHDVSESFVRQTGCASCHHNSLVSLASAAARSHGYAAPPASETAAAAFMPPYLESWRERALQNISIAGGPDTVSYLLVGMAADGYPADLSSDAQAIALARRQEADGHWAIQTLRPPIESNDIEVTAMSLRAIQLFAPPTRRAEFGKAVDRARAWLTGAVPMDTEQLAFKLLGLAWAGAPKTVIADAARELAAAQREDGGWSQRERGGSDAYATGEALVALRESGAAAATDTAFRRGLAFLLSTQFEDGTWFVESHSVPIQAYFDSGFPFGVNQWISAAATAWATWALSLAE